MNSEYTKPQMWVLDMQPEDIIATSFTQTSSGENKPLEDLVVNPIDIGDTFE
ncbi:MAG: hypothetical protein IKR18_00330 [Bacteroidaceae bacterium]|nr:hypothetical protein [Bacteroidaceae bacterium]